MNADSGSTKSVACEFCGRTFSSIAGLRTHAVRMHAAEMDATRPPGGGDTAKEMALMALCSLQSQFESYFSQAQRYDVQTAIDLLRQPDEPAGRSETECRYCKRPVNSDGCIFHEGDCAGLQERRISRLRLDWLREHPESVAYEFSETKEGKS